MLRRLCLSLLGLGPAALSAAPCEELVQAALARYAARAPYAEAIQAARGARTCAGTSAPPGLYAAEAWGLVNEERWDDLLTLWNAYRRAFPSPDALPLDVGARVESAVGVALVVHGQASEGVALQRRLLARLPATRPQEQAATLSALAWSYSLTGDYAAAETAYEAMERVVQAHLYGPARRPMQLRAQSERAGNVLAWHESGQMPDAPRRLRRALQLARAAATLARLEEDPSSEAIARLFEGEALHYLGRPGEAIAPFTRVKALPDETYWPYAEWDLARLAARAARNAEAIAGYRRALAALAEDPADTRDLFYELGALYERARRWPDAEAAYRSAIRALDRLLATAGTDDSWLQSQAVWERPYRGLSRVLAQTGRPAEALSVLDAAQARYLDVYRSRAALRSEGSGPTPALLAAQEAARDSLAGLLSPANRARLEARLEGLTAALAASTQLKPRLGLRVEALQAHLRREGQALIGFLLDAPEPFLQRPLHSFAFVVTPDTVAALPLPRHAAELNAAVARISPVLFHPEAGGFQARQFEAHALTDVFAATLGPAWHYLRSYRRLVVIPEGPLFSVPFAALTLPGGGELGQQVALSTELAPSLLLRSSVPKALPGAHVARLLVAARSRFGPTEAAPLPHVRGEVAAITEAVRARVLLDAQAQESRVRAEAEHVQVLHLATHTELGSASPLYYALRLSPDAHEDGLLRLHEVQSLHLPLQLAVLSGCATARGVLHPGEGMAGLQYGIRAAGAQSVVATLWLVDDAAMAELMGRFYRALARGAPTDVALQQAQQGYRQRHPRASPFLWAAPVLYGPARTVSLQPQRWVARRAVRFGGIGAGLLAGLGAGALAYRKRRRYAHRPPRPLRRDPGPRH